jgi:hypothetical protein
MHKNRSALKASMKFFHVGGAALVVLLILFGLGTIKLRGGENPRLRVEGDYTYTAVVKGTPHSQTRAFSIETQGMLWLIRSVPLDSAGNTNQIEYYESGYDGEFIYEVTKLTGKVSEPEELFRLGEKQGMGSTSLAHVIYTNRVPKGFHPKNQAVARIYADSFPAITSSRVVPVWLAFGSSHYFQTNQTGAARQIWERAEPMPSRDMVKATWDLTRGAPSFLQNLNYFLTPPVGWPITHSADGSAAVAGVTYTVTAFTNIGDVILPLGFSVIRLNEADVYDRKSSPRLLYKYECRASKFSFLESIEPQQFQPKLEFNCDTEDLRLEVTNISQTRPRYLITNGIWPVIETTHKLKTARWASSPDRTQSSKQSSKKRQVAMFGFIIISSLSLAVLIMKSTNPKTKHK